jgi:hypothetical protein
MNEQAHKEFLQKIACEVERLLVKHQERFRQYGDEFYKKWTAYGEAYQQWRKKIEENVKEAWESKDKRLHTHTVEPPIPGYVFYDGCWIPYVEEPICPALRITGDIQPKSDEEVLENSYVLLIIIHDWVGKSFVPICHKPPIGLAGLVGCFNPNFIDDVAQTIIETSLEYVKADLANLKPAEPGQNSIPAKIWAMLCKLYEITLKVIVDAVLDRMWPKPQ